MAAAATMFAACSQNEVLNEVQVQDEAQAIGFSTYAGKVTRAENNSTATVKTDLESHHSTFKVWGYKNTHTDYVFDGVTVTADNGAWTYSPKKYWDKAATNYEFYAAAPNSDLWNLSSNGTLQNDDYFYFNSFELQGKSLEETTRQSSFSSVNSDDCDLMIASPCQVTNNMFGNGNKVQLAFNHILSRLNVTVNKGRNIEGEILNITSFKVYNLKNKGGFNEAAEGVTSTQLAAGTCGRWTASGSYSVEGNPLNGVLRENAGNQYIYQSLVIPQVIESETVRRDGKDVTAASAPYFTIEYTIGTVSDYEPFSATFNLAQAFAKANGMVLCEGYENTLNITIDAETIEFDAVVYEWTDKNVNNFDIQ